MGIEIVKYDHTDSAGNFNYGELASRAEAELQPTDIFLLHGCCHNPTGIDPTREQWRGFIDLCNKKGSLVFIDFAYHGFAKSTETDQQPILDSFRDSERMILAYSFSKTMGLYCERTGAIFAKATDPSEANKIRSNLSTLVRQNISNPPAHGLRIVERILENDSSIADWQEELTECRQRIIGIRRTIRERLGSCHDYYMSIEKFNGMFGMFPIGIEQVNELKSRYSIFLLNNGRVNLAGINSGNVDYVIDCIKKVCFS